MAEHNMKKNVQNQQHNLQYLKFIYELIYMLRVCNISLQIIVSTIFRSFKYKYETKRTFKKKAIATLYFSCTEQMGEQES